jgi:hypothetical protein
MQRSDELCKKEVACGNKAGECYSPSIAFGKIRPSDVADGRHRGNPDPILAIGKRAVPVPLGGDRPAQSADPSPRSPRIRYRGRVFDGESSIALA